MTGMWIWLTAAILYVVFYRWYDGPHRPLRRQDIDSYLKRLEESAVDTSPQRLARLRAFLEADDGREFFMVNLIRMQQGNVRSPSGGEAKPAREVLEGYTNHFMRALFRRAGHPVLLGLNAGPYLEEWNVDPDPGWSFAGVIRYRSRRDMIELVLDPRFAQAHLYKQVAIERTFAFPAKPGPLPLSPRILVGLVLALLAALVQLIS